MTFREGLGAGKEGLFRLGVFEGGRFLAATFPLILILAASGAVTAQSATASGSCFSYAEATGSTQAQSATVSAIASISMTVSGAVTSQSATASGNAAVLTGDREAFGVVQAQSARGVGAAAIVSEASGTGLAQSATSLGQSEIQVPSFGTGNSQSATGTGSSEVPTGDREAVGAVNSQSAIASGVALTQAESSGAVQAQASTASGSAVVVGENPEATGTVQAQSATASGVAATATTATGSSVAQAAIASGVASVEVGASGSPTSQSATATGNTNSATEATGSTSSNATATGSANMQVESSGSAQAQAATATGTASDGVDYSFLTNGLIGAWGLRQLIPSYSGNTCRLERASDSTLQSYTGAEIDADAHKSFHGTSDLRVDALFDQSGNARTANRVGTGDTNALLAYRDSTTQYYEINGHPAIAPPTPDTRRLVITNPVTIRSMYAVLSNVPPNDIPIGLCGKNAPNSSGSSYIFLATNGSYQVSADGNKPDRAKGAINDSAFTASGLANLSITGTVFPSSPILLTIIYDSHTNQAIEALGVLSTTEAAHDAAPDTHFAAFLFYDTDKTADHAAIVAHLMGLFGIT